MTNNNNGTGITTTVSPLSRYTAREGIGLAIPKDIDRQEWITLGAALFGGRRRLDIYAVDWIEHGLKVEQMPPKDLLVLIAQLGREIHSEQTLYNYSSMFNRWPPRRRKWEVSVSHYMAIPDTVDNQTAEALLASAEEHQWSVNELKRQLRLAQTRTETQWSNEALAVPKRAGQVTWSVVDRNDPILKLIRERIVDNNVLEAIESGVQFQLIIDIYQLPDVEGSSNAEETTA